MSVDIFNFLKEKKGIPVNATWPNKDILIWKFTSAIQIISLNENYELERIHNGKFERQKINTVEELKGKLSELNIEL